MMFTKKSRRNGGKTATKSLWPEQLLVCLSGSESDLVGRELAMIPLMNKKKKSNFPHPHQLRRKKKRKKKKRRKKRRRKKNKLYFRKCETRHSARNRRGHKQCSSPTLLLSSGSCFAIIFR